MTGLEIAAILTKVLPAVAAQGVSLWLRIVNSDRVRSLPDGAEKEAEIQRVLTELRVGASSTEELDRILAAP